MRTPPCRGVVHGDIKPSNLLLEFRDEARSGWGKRLAQKTTRLYDGLPQGFRNSPPKAFVLDLFIYDFSSSKHFTERFTGTDFSKTTSM
jgi:serine/threonine protein kinase